MGLFDKIVSMVGDNISGGPQNKGLFQQAINLIESSDAGGLSGLIEKFQNGGLGDVAASWVGKGENQPVSGEQMITPWEVAKFGRLPQVSAFPIQRWLMVLLPHCPNSLIS